MQIITDWLDAYPIFWPVFIILARIMDVSLGTVRTICVVRGARWTAAILGFVEVIVWVLAVSGVLVQPTLVKVLSYGIGFALGNACGVWVEGKLAMGQQRIIAISRHYSQAIAMAMRMADYTVTELPARGKGGEVAMCFAIVPRKQTQKVMNIICGADEDAVVIVEDVRQTVMSRRPGGATGWRAILKRK